MHEYFSSQPRVFLSNESVKELVLGIPNENDIVE